MREPDAESIPDEQGVYWNEKLSPPYRILHSSPHLPTPSSPSLSPPHPTFTYFVDSQNPYGGGY